MTRHIDDSLLQDFREGLLDPEAEGQVREHLDECFHCREELEALTELLDGLGDLDVEAQPSRDLWPQIAWRMEGAKTRSHPGRGRRVNLPAWQLLAAGIALIVISGGSVWAFLSGRMEAGAPLGSAQQAPALLVGWEEAYGGYDQAVTELETVLERGREVLDPETVRVLEENLQTIDRAIQEAGEALMQDPASTALQRFLADNLRKKVELLRQAAGAVYANS